ncbi:hypothetical protein LCGC14_0520640 [marine sediment metagenome]|uniref:Uncharacterized protein n=1 Tax=marine sediment metagenome TaxID=412755 RepID=A0A0F9UK69_9ZZZZ
MTIEDRAVSILGYARKSLVEGAGGDLVASVAHDIVYLCERMRKAEEKRDELQDDVWDLTCQLENEEP